LSISRDGRTLYATRVFGMTLSAIDIASGTVTKTVALAERAVYDAAVGGRPVRLRVDVGRRLVRVYIAGSLTLVGE
jgi:hypothetical protein